jgi:hypothetical protein
MSQVYPSSGYPGHPANLTASTNAVLIRGTNPGDSVSYFAGGGTAFGLTWTHADSSDSGAGNQDYTLSATSSLETSKGTWTLSSFNSHVSVMICIEIESANEFACFLIDQAGGLSGTWSLLNWTGFPVKRLTTFYNG